MGKKKSAAANTVESAEEDGLQTDVHDGIHDQIKRMLKPDHLSYVLVTCRKSSFRGKMDVEMSFEGDPLLASYLIEGAQEHLDQDLSES